MKKILSAIFLLTLPLLVQAQVGWLIGAKGGGNATLFLNNTLFQFDTLKPRMSPGFFIGGHLQYNYVKDFGVDYVLTYTSVDQKIINNRLKVDEVWVKKLRYIDLATLFRYSAGRSFHFIELGPQVSYLIAAKEVFTDSIRGYPASNTKDLYEKYNISAIFSTGGDWFITRNVRFTAGIRFVFGFIELYKEDNKYDDYHIVKYEPARLFTASLAFGLSYSFDFTRVIDHY